MKVTNVLGNDYTGTIGDMVTASHWKGRNYLKKWFKPANPNSLQQQRVRAFWTAAVAMWQALVADAKGAYAHKARYDKLSITAFNTMVKSYMDLLLAGLVYTGPTAGYILVEDSVTTNPIEGALFVAKKTGQSTEYMRGYTGADGKINDGLTVEDENYDGVMSATGYTPLSFTGRPATNVFDDTTWSMVPIP